MKFDDHFSHLTIFLSLFLHAYVIHTHIYISTHVITYTTYSVFRSKVATCVATRRRRMARPPATSTPRSRKRRRSSSRRRALGSHKSWRRPQRSPMRRLDLRDVFWMVLKKKQVRMRKGSLGHIPPCRVVCMYIICIYLCVCVRVCYT